MGRDIEIGEWKEAWSAGAAGASSKLVERYKGVSGKPGRLTSTSALANFKANVISARAIKKRTRKLKALTDEQMNRGMEEKGAAAYAAAVGSESIKEKAASGFAPFASVINSERAKLPPKTADGMANLTNRAGPIVKALIAKAAELG